MQVVKNVRDPRYFQILFQTIFLAYGFLFLSWQKEYPVYLIYIFSCVATQFLAEVINKKSTTKFQIRFSNGLPSAIITALGLCLLLKTNSLYVAAFASVLSIASKYLIKINGRHIFNPSALGIIAAVWLTGRAWVSPGQWGSNVVLVFGVIILGTIITTRIQKADISLAFLGSFALLMFCRQILYLGWPLDFFIQSFSTGSLLIFSFFMISDPKTIPTHRVVRIVWGIAVGAISFFLTAFQFMNGAPILVLVLSQPLVPVLNKIFKAESFEWISNKFSGLAKPTFIPPLQITKTI